MYELLSQVDLPIDALLCQQDRCCIHNDDLQKYYWHETKKLTSKRSKSVSTVIDNVTECDAIADRFANKYDELYTSVAFDENE